MNGTTMTNPTSFLGKVKKIASENLFHLVKIVMCARNFKHERMDNQLKKTGEQEPNTCSIRWGWIWLAKKGWPVEGGTAGKRREGVGVGNL